MTIFEYILEGLGFAFLLYIGFYFVENIINRRKK